MIGTIVTDRSYQFLHVITRVGHTEGPQRDVSGLNADIAMKRGRERERRWRRKTRKESLPAYALENQRGLNR